MGYTTMADQLTDINLIAEKFFPGQVQVIPVTGFNDTGAIKHSLLHTHFYYPLSSGTYSCLILEITGWLYKKEETAVYSFYSVTKDKNGTAPEWQLNSCRLNRWANGDPKELVMFNYDLSFLEQAVKPRLYPVLEREIFIKENLARAATLTRREKEIIGLLTNGMSSKEIAANIFISVHTVNTHRQHINEKLGIRHFSELLKLADAFELAKPKLSGA